MDPYLGFIISLVVLAAAVFALAMTDPYAPSPSQERADDPPHRTLHPDPLYPDPDRPLEELTPAITPRKEIA